METWKPTDTSRSVRESPDFSPLHKLRYPHHSNLDLSGLPVDFSQINRIYVSKNLNLSHTKVTSDIPLSLEYSTFLINLSHSNIRDLGSLNLNVIDLDLSFTEIKDLQPLLQMRHLRRIRIEGIAVEPELLTQIQTKLEQNFSYAQGARILHEVTPVTPFILTKKWGTSPEW